MNGGQLREGQSVSTADAQVTSSAIAVTGRVTMRKGEKNITKESKSQWSLEIKVIMSHESIPKDLRNLRACLLCSMIKTLEQFEYDGCDNCEEHLGMKGNRDMVYECTSANFDGMIAMMGPEDSWVAKWQRICKFSWNNFFCHLSRMCVA
ncbi:SUPT4H1 [Cordylochernes scorpioides]|uniref:SUPT4H1 n=1 Tax=Cordylochernes scorpioides TaxID=51811 RepID=A0ABY6LFK5_9ARAC|nr:SUPT4H1 [Cordylochernes scorpioides]